MLTTGAGFTTIDNDLAAVVTLLASLVVTVKVKVPVAVGVPEITPVAAAKDRPPGNAPDAMAHDAYGLVPPVAANVCEYEPPMLTAGNDDVLTVGNAPTVIDKDLEAETMLRLSVTVTEKLAVPVAVGVPEMTPVVVSSVRPAGSEPDNVHVEYEPVPPDAASV